MKVKKAIMDLQEYIGSGEYNGTNPPIYLDTATSAISALEKLVPKKTVEIKRDSDTKIGAITFKAGTTLYKCQCGNIIRPNDSYCFRCGQSLDWSVKENDKT